ncbi:MAG: selenium binding protein [Pseudobutyrivibrio sp.]|uniref:selenium binding protein n=1 Tax=Pseudobutyrivibrio sp. TaxID=2014367 RepID=UPI0025DF8217|nr:selenium binding protein [Pseudobutyrivibrio sp.]MBQ8488315.1 selenium binding protein [Pseudobutyrivibrio sp.]
MNKVVHISLPDEEYLKLLGIAMSAFSSNNSFVIENILYNETCEYDWYELTDKESGYLYDIIKQSINEDIANDFKAIVNMRNRIIHGFRITSKTGEQILGTKTKIKDGNIQFEITKDYLEDFIFKNDNLSIKLNSYRNSLKNTIDIC